MPRIAAINQDRGISPRRNKGAAVHLVAMREAFIALGAEVEAFDCPDDAKLEAALAGLAGARGFDMVYERYAIGKSTAARYAREHGIPLVMEVNAPLADEQQMFRNETETGPDREHDRFALSQADCVVAVSGQVAEYARRRGARKDAIMVCPNGIDTRRFNLQADADEVRRQWVPENAFVLGFHGRLRPWHGFDELVAVFSQLLKRELPVHLLVVGEGEFTELDALPPNSFTRVGWQPHERMPGFVAAFDALPLTYQPGVPCYFSPLKLMEAMACGVVPVVPDLGDLARVVEHGRTGLVYPPGDQQRLEHLLAELVRSSDDRLRIGQQAACEAQKHSWEAIARSILQKVSEGSERSAIQVGPG